MTIHPFPSKPDCTAPVPPMPSSGFVVIDRVTAYWASLPRSGAAPDRAQVDASALADILPHVFLAELATTRVARLRIIGHKIEQLLGMEMRGMPLTALFAGTARQDIMSALEQVSRGTRVILSIKSDAGFMKPGLKGAIALLPLKNSSGEITHVLGALAHEGHDGKNTHRFSLTTPIDVMPVEPRNPPMPQPAPHNRHGQPEPRPALRVITGGKA